MKIIHNSEDFPDQYVGNLNTPLLYIKYRRRMIFNHNGKEYCTLPQYAEIMFRNRFNIITREPIYDDKLLSDLKEVSEIYPQFKIYRKFRHDTPASRIFLFYLNAAGEKIKIKKNLHAPDPIKILRFVERNLESYERRSLTKLIEKIRYISFEEYYSKLREAFQKFLDGREDKGRPIMFHGRFIITYKSRKMMKFLLDKRPTDFDKIRNCIEDIDIRGGMWNLLLIYDMLENLDFEIRDSVGNDLVRRKRGVRTVYKLDHRYDNVFLDDSIYSGDFMSETLGNYAIYEHKRVYVIVPFASKRGISNVKEVYDVEVIYLDTIEELAEEERSVRSLDYDFVFTSYFEHNLAALVFRRIISKIAGNCEYIEDEGAGGYGAYYKTDIGL